MKNTDWDKYYKSPTPTVSITRFLSRKKIHHTIEMFVDEFPRDICELGGANSCFMNSFLSINQVKSYHIIDLNSYGLSLLKEKAILDNRVTIEKNDVLSFVESKMNYDLVYSVGLIEHFDRKGTREAISTHFKCCKEGGYVLITFPTPTWLYRIIRWAAERLDIWHFHDERQLCFSEVMDNCSQYGDLLHRSINWSIGLTQGYVLYRKKVC